MSSEDQIIKVMILIKNNELESLNSKYISGIPFALPINNYFHCITKIKDRFSLA